MTPPTSTQDIRTPIGIFGGTFDPVHLGHLRSALEVQEALQLDHVRMLPCGSPPHRAAPVASGSQRRAMLEAALRGLPGLVLDELELKRPGASYMVDTLRALREEFPAAPLVLILGADAFAGLEKWSRWEALPELAHIAVMTRPGWQMPADGALAHMLQQRLVYAHTELHTRPVGCVLQVPVTQLAIAASDIRARLAAGRSVRYLVPDAVRELIESENLYSG